MYIYIKGVKDFFFIPYTEKRNNIIPLPHPLPKNVKQILMVVCGGGGGGGGVVLYIIKDQAFIKRNSRIELE